jgi:hypothetical protein
VQKKNKKVKFYRNFWKWNPKNEIQKQMLTLVEIHQALLNASILER